MTYEAETTTTLFLTDATPGPVNVMLDLETWGTAPGSAIRSIGAVMFDPYGEGHGEEFYMNIDDQSCVDAGLVRDASTVRWWAQDSNARAAEVFARDPRPLRDVSVAFSDWFRKNRAIFVWSQGANFDQPIWEAATRKIAHGVPWRFWDSRCTRTAYDVCRFNNKAVRFSGIPHYALDDAKHQVTCVQRAYANVAR